MFWPIHNQICSEGKLTWVGFVNYKLALTKSNASEWRARAFAVCLYGDWTPCCYSCSPSAPPEGAQGGVRPSVLQGIWWDRSLDSWMFLGILWSQSLYLLISREALNPFMVTSDPQDGQKPFCKMSASWYWTPLHQNLIYWPSPLNGKPLQYSCLENPINGMKRQKDRTLKLLRLVGA